MAAKANYWVIVSNSANPNFIFLLIVRRAGLDCFYHPDCLQQKQLQGVTNAAATFGVVANPKKTPRLRNEMTRFWCSPPSFGWRAGIGRRLLNAPLIKNRQRTVGEDGAELPGRRAGAAAGARRLELSVPRARGGADGGGRLPALGCGAFWGTKVSGGRTAQLGWNPPSRLKPAWEALKASSPLGAGRAHPALSSSPALLRQQRLSTRAAAG